jgi:hypothetical protein
MGLVLALAVFAGCSSDDGASPNQTATGQSGVFEGAIEADFAITLRSAVGENSPLQGPFVLRGYNVRYDDALGATVCDLTLKNEGEVPHSEPVGITFINLLPAGVEILNPDNGENGNGASIVFQFPNSDGMWSPGEESDPRETQFRAASNVAIGFVARLDISTQPPGGSIGGVVWNDMNENGEMDPGEDGIGGVTIMLESSDAPPDTMPPDTMMTAAMAVDQTMTADDGSYRFDGLEAGFYTVGKEPTPDYLPTTPNPMFVILTEDTSGVSSFLTANFGCVPMDNDTMPAGPTLSEGDYVAVNGHWDGDQLVALGVDYFECEEDTGGVEPPDTMPDPMALLGSDDGEWNDHDCWNWNDWICGLHYGKIRGPVTAIDTASTDSTDTGMWVEIMGTQLKVMLIRDHSSKALTCDDIEVGDRVEARVKYTDEGWVAWRLREWRGRKEQVHGFVEEVMGNGSLKVRVFDTWVMIPDDVCYNHDCDHDGWDDRDGRDH